MRDVYYWLRTGTRNTPLVQFHFYHDGEREMVEIIQPNLGGNIHSFVALWEFCRDMFPISQEASSRQK